MMNDLLADTITRIRNSYKVGEEKVKVLKSNLIKNVLEALKKDGFIESFNELSDFRFLEVWLRYSKNGDPAIFFVKKRSTPGCRRYINVEQLKKNRTDRFGVKIISTSKGVMNHIRAIEQKIGGEYLLEVQ